MTTDTRAAQALQSPFAEQTDQVEALLNQFRKPQTLALSTLKGAIAGPVNWPGISALEVGEQDGDLITVIDISQKLLAQMLPSAAELPLLTHARKSTSTVKDAQGKDQQLVNELAVLIGKRLPRKGAISTVHLVSLEHRFSDGTFITQTKQTNSLTRLVSLKSWQFACAAEEHRFEGLLTGLDHTPGTLRLPSVDNIAAEAVLAKGYTLLPHRLRQGERTASWYHGPFLGGEDSTSFELPARAADALVRYDPKLGLFDVSYAAAWELGRLLALQNKAFSTSLFLWKRTVVQQNARLDQQGLYAHLPLPQRSQTLLRSVDDGVPDDISSWFKTLSLLQGVPFNYLVPDERMLPAESLRFFQVDPLWISCLLDGAFSIGRSLQSDHMQDGAYPVNPAENPHPKVSGFLLRSALVAGWPNVEVAASDKGDYFTSTNSGGNPLKLLRRDLLSPNALLCLFEGDVQSVAVSQKLEELHFGFDLATDAAQHPYKKLRDAQGNFSGAKIDPVPWQAQTRVVDIVELAKGIKTDYSSASFAYQMIEQTPRVVFQKGQ